MKRGFWAAIGIRDGGHCREIMTRRFVPFGEDPMRWEFRWDADELPLQLPYFGKNLVVGAALKPAGQIIVVAEAGNVVIMPGDTIGFDGRLSTIGVSTYGLGGSSTEYEVPI